MLLTQGHPGQLPASTCRAQFMGCPPPHPEALCSQTPGTENKQGRSLSDDH